jgi:glucose/arabinose dehydrogenase
MKSGTYPTAIAIVFLAGSALTAFAAGEFDRTSQIGPNPVLPEPNAYLVPQLKVAKVIGWQPGESPQVADGLKIEALATGLHHPRQPYTLPNGDILVVESNGPGVEKVERPKDLVMGLVMKMSAGGAPPPGNRITILHDAKGTGLAAQKSVFLEGLHSPFGVVLVNDELFVANTDGIMRYPYKTGDLKITGAGTLLTELPAGPINHHWTKSLAASADGSRLYVSIGSNSNILENGEGAERDRAAIWEVDRATGKHRLYATGLRNANGLTFYPGSDTLWAVINERDELGPNLVPDYLTSVKDGAFYGWPYSYYGQHVDPRVHPQRPDLVAAAIPPDYGLSSHVAPLGLVFTTSAAAALPPQYASGAFIGQHGSWNRNSYNGYDVVYVPFKNSRPDGKATPIVAGFLSPQGQAHGRPVGVALDKTGALIIADDVGNTVWRVSKK